MLQSPVLLSEDHMQLLGGCWRIQQQQQQQQQQGASDLEGEVACMEDTLLGS
jgi:hypothetical protein